MLKKILLTGLFVLFSMNLSASEPIYDEEIPLLWSSIITVSGGILGLHPDKISIFIQCLQSI